MSIASFYSTFSCDPFYNMAMDEWLLERANQNRESVLMRLYSWSSGAITIGVNQEVTRAVIPENLNSTPLIRRITGGRALFHEPSELTYSIAVNYSNLTNCALGRTLRASSNCIARGLVTFLNELGMEAQIVRQSSCEFLKNSGAIKGHCFQSTTRDEIIGRFGKLAGSAQRRFGDSFLQHGSIKLSGVASHPALPGTAEKFCEVPELQVLQKASFDEYAGLFVSLMARQLGVDYEVKRMSMLEEDEIKERTRFLKKNSLQKRNPVKQIRQGICL